MPNKLKYIFFGTPIFAATILKELIDAGVPPIALVCNPDEPIGRKQVMTPPLTKKLVLESGLDIKILQPNKLTPEIIEEIKRLEADMYLIAAYGKIIPRALIDVPERGAICVHPSMLPKLRGATPVQTAILDGFAETGVTLFNIDEQVDHGPIVSQEMIGIDPEDNTETLLYKTAITASKMVLDLLQHPETIYPLPQDEDEASYTKKIATGDAFIEPADLKKALEEGGDTALTIDRKIHAYYSEPGAWTMENNKRLKLLDSKIEDGKLKLKMIQWEGEKPKAVK